LKVLREAIQRDRDYSIGLLRELIRIPTLMPGGTVEDQARSLDLCRQALAGLGFRLEAWISRTGNHQMVATYEPARMSAPGIVLNCHLDVVPVGSLADWHHDPFGAEMEGDRIYGRGACDMKGGVVAVLAAMRALLGRGYEPRGRIVLQLVTDEEYGDIGTKECVARGHVADVSLVAEPTNLKMVTSEAGIEQFRVEVHGLATHSSARRQYVHAGGGLRAANAIEKAVKVILAFQELEREWAVHKNHPLLPPGSNTINPGIIRGGPGGGKDGQLLAPSHPGTTADYCALEYDVCYLPSETQAEIRGELGGYLDRICQADPWLSEHPPRVTWGIHGLSAPPAVMPLDHPFIRDAREAFKDLGWQFAPAAVNWTSDLPWLAQGGAPGVVFGPGGAEFAHGPDEFITADDTLQAALLIAVLVGRWTQAGSHLSQGGQVGCATSTGSLPRPRSSTARVRARG